MEELSRTICIVLVSGVLLFIICSCSKKSEKTTAEIAYHEQTDRVLNLVKMLLATSNSNQVVIDIGKDQEGNNRYTVLEKEIVGCFAQKGPGWREEKPYYTLDVTTYFGLSPEVEAEFNKHLHLSGFQGMDYTSAAKALSKTSSRMIKFRNWCANNGLKTTDGELRIGTLAKRDKEGKLTEREAAKLSENELREANNKYISLLEAVEPALKKELRAY